jgi:hypothetical protein
MPSSSVSRSPRDVDIVDGLSLYQVGERVKQLFNLEKAPLSYTALHDVLKRTREQHGFRPAEHSSLPISYDPKSDAQGRFLTAIERTEFEPDPVDYRDLYVSLPPGTTPKDSDEKPIASFASRIAYVLGRLSRHSDPHILVVSHCFELFWPLQNIMLQNPGARVAIAYFEKFADFRWQYAHVNGAEGAVRFFPLDANIPELFGIDRYDTDDRSTQGRQRKEVRGLNKY